MNLTAKILLGVFGGGGFTATTSWFIYDNVNPTLAKQYKDKWKPIQLTITKPAENTSYKGSSCFQKFFGLTIQNFSTATASETSSSESQIFGNLFGNAQSNIYGCAVGEGKNFYELVLKTETTSGATGFATWYDGSQKTFKLEKKSGDNDWKIELGIWATGIPPTNDFKEAAQVKDKTGKWSWLFYMPISKGQASTNMQKWSDVFKGTTATAFYKDNKWSSSSSFTPGQGKIPDFNKVETLDNFCEKEGAMRKPIPEGDRKLEVFCLFSK